MNKKENNKIVYTCKGKSIEENNKDYEFDYEKFLSECKSIAQIIWDNSFMSGLEKINKSQLIGIVNLLVVELDYFKNILKYEESFEDFPFDDRKAKDISFDCKCLLIEALDPHFFEEK